ncbi:MAG: hypothetical protein WC829_24215 [Hyphomicrobium sp.]|jgi:hypothetical protein
MHSLTIWFGPAATSIVLLYKEEEKACVVYNAFTEHQVLHAEKGSLIGSDDFGQNFSIAIDGISGMLLEDMALSQEAAIERGLHQARSQAKAQKLAMTDPIISASLRQQQMGPAVLAPGMMPNGRGMM